MKTPIPFILLSLFFSFCSAQNKDLKRTSRWYFGDSAGLDFTSGFPMVDSLGSISTLERTAVISDTTGQLIAYFGHNQQMNQWCIFNRNHQPMINGCGLGPANVSTPRDCAVFVPKPGDDSTYYLFTVDGWENQFQRGLRWYEIDLRLDNGLGVVISNDNLLYAPVSEQLAATRHSNGCDYWIVTHERSSNKFLAFKVTSQGVDSVPVSSSIGQDYAIAQQSYSLNGGYHMVFSTNGSKALVHVVWNYPITHLSDQVQLMDFDNSSGIFSNSFDLPYDTTGSHGFFSPDNSKVYFESCYFSPCRFYQFDLTSGDSSIIKQSRTVVYNSPTAIESDGQIGIDGRIYLAGEWDHVSQTANPRFLSVITNPNTAGIICNIQYGTQPLGSGRATQGLPNFVANFLVNVPAPQCQYTSVGYIKLDGNYNISVFPNPADQQVIVSSFSYPEDNTTISLYDVIGHLWLEKEITHHVGKAVLEVSMVPKGVYLLEIKTNKQRKTFKLIIQH